MAEAVLEALTVRPEECAQMLGIGRSKCFELIRSGEIQAIHIGRSVRIPVEPLRVWIREQAAREAALRGDPAAGSR